MESWKDTVTVSTLEAIVPFSFIDNQITNLSPRSGITILYEDNKKNKIANVLGTPL